MADRVTLSLKDYLSQSDRKGRILIVSDVSKGNTLLRMHEKNTGTMVQNVSCQNLSWVVNQIFIYEQASKGFEAEYELIDEQTALMLFRSVLLDTIDSLKYYKDKEKLLSIVTSKEIYDKVNLMRSNECVLDNDNDRISDLKALIDRYEAELEAQKKHDTVARTRYVLKCLRKDSVLAKDVFGEGTELSYLKEETELYSAVQNEMLELLSADEVFCFDAAIVEKKVLEDLSAKKDNISFFKGMGSYNEANYIAYDILHNGYNYGDTLVLFNSAAQLPAIRSALIGNGISARVVSNYPAIENDVISLARNIIAWAQDDYSEKALEKILGSSIIYVPGEFEVKKKDDKKDIDAKEDSNTDNDAEDISADNTDSDNLSEEEKTKIKKRNLLAGNRYYRYVTNARRMGDESFTLGWGYQRNRDYAKHERDYTSANKDKEDVYNYSALEIIDMHEAMLDIFKEIGLGGKLSPSALFDRLYKFVKEYSRPIFAKNEATNRWRKIDESREIGLGLLGNLSKALAFDSRELTTTELLAFADEALSTLKLSDSTASNAVAVRALNDWTPLDRPHIYVIGLSLNEMQVSSNQSPVIRDEEIEKYLAGKNCYIPTVEQQIQRRNLTVYRTLSTFDKGTIAFGYSYWNAEKKAENNPSFLFTAAYETIKEGKEPIIFFEYGNPDENKILDKDPVKQKTSSIIKDFEQLELSSSSLERLLECPKRFAYEKVLHLPDNSYNEKNMETWLNPLSKGTFFHDILEAYSRSDLRLSTEELTDDEKNKITEIINTKIIPKMQERVPTADPNIDKRETDALIEDEVFPYINDLRKDMKKNGWKIWLPEVEFDDLKLPVKAYSDEVKEVTIQIRSGFLDCVDYRLDEANRKVGLRIRDYKTGKFYNKKKSYEAGKLIQFFIYSKALKEYLLDLAKEKITDLEKGKTAGWSFEVVGFSYDFPSDRKETYQKIQIDVNNMDSKNLVRLGAIITAMNERKTYPDIFELYYSVYNLAHNLEEAKDSRAKEISDLSSILAASKGTDGVFTGPCKHCAYKDLCENRKAGNIQDAKY